MNGCCRSVAALIIDRDGVTTGSAPAQPPDVDARTHSRLAFAGADCGAVPHR